MGQSTKSFRGPGGRQARGRMGADSCPSVQERSTRRCLGAARGTWLHFQRSEAISTFSGVPKRFCFSVLKRWFCQRSGATHLPFPASPAPSASRTRKTKKQLRASLPAWSKPPYFSPKVTSSECCGKRLEPQGSQTGQTPPKLFSSDGCAVVLGPPPPTPPKKNGGIPCLLVSP